MKSKSVLSNQSRSSLQFALLFRPAVAVYAEAEISSPYSANRVVWRLRENFRSLYAF